LPGFPTAAAALAFAFAFASAFSDVGLMGAQKYVLGKNKLLSEVNAQNVYSNFTLAATFSSSLSPAHFGRLLTKLI